MLNSRLIPEGGLISKSFLFWLKSQFSKKGIMSIFSIVFWQLFFGDLSQSQKLSEIKQGPLITFYPKTTPAQIYATQCSLGTS